MKRNVKHWIVFLTFLLLPLIAGVMVFAGGEKEEEEIVLKFWSMQQSDRRVQDNQNSVIQAFQEQNPGVRVELEVTPYAGYRDKVLVAAKGGNPPDICVVDQIWNSEFAAANLIIPLDGYLSGSPIKADQFFEGAWDSCLWRGQVWGVPMDVGVWEQLFYNEDLFNEAGVSVPETWNEWLEVGRKLTKDTDGDGEADQWGLYLLGFKGELVTVFMNSLIFSNGGQIVSEDGTRGMLDSREVIEALEFYKALMEIAPPGVPNADQVQSSDYFATAKVAMQTIGEWEQETVRNRAPDLNWKIAVPPVPRKGMTFHGCFGGWSFVIFKESEHQDEAWEFIQFASSEENNIKMAALTPANLNAADTYLREFKQQPEIVFETLFNAMPRPISPIYPQISEIQSDMIQEIFLGKDVTQAARDANDSLNALLAGE
jgi:multiple sugar transport system substrate-binding protein